MIKHFTVKNDNNNNSFKGIKIEKQNFNYYFKKWRQLLDKGSTLSILFAGVGGQGIILATKVLAEAALKKGLDIKVSEVHGMAQRGGSVLGSVRIGREVFSPTINKADFIIALEKLEALRYIDKLDCSGFIIINDFKIYPISVFSGSENYPEDIISKVEDKTPNYILVKAVEIAKRLGEIRTSNIILIGCLSNFIPIEEKFWIQSIKESVPAKAINVNIEAFKEGRQIVNKY
ncbi:MAG: indolepyruvate oxidoreductase subunit beta [Actinobacteria bacterium]|nr:indolepyruvate oxidoreductase subunit beta [Actinomycetota bacterium]